MQNVSRIRQEARALEAKAAAVSRTARLIAKAQRLARALREGDRALAKRLAGLILERAAELDELLGE